MRRLLPWLETLLRRYPWVITLVALIPCAYFAARGTGEMVGAKAFAADTEALARPIPAGAATSAEPTSAAQNRHVRDRVAIVHRNIFDSAAGCLDCPAAAGGAGVAANPLDDRILPPEPCVAAIPHEAAPYPQACESQAKILGAVVS